MAVREQIYRGSGEVSRAAPLPESSPAAFGAGIGDALAGAGSEIQASSLRAMEVEKQRKREAANAQAGVDAAQLSINLNHSAQAARDDAPIDGGGHVERVAQESQSAVDAFLGTIADPKVRDQWRVRAASMRGNVIEEEDGWARGRRIEAIGTNIRDAGKLWDNQLQGNPDPAVFSQSIDSVDQVLEGVSAPANVKLKLATEQKASRAQNYGRGLIEKDPAAALAVFGSGALDQWLQPDDKKVLIDQAEAGVRVALADQNRQVSQAKAQALTQAQGISQRIAQGVVVPDDEITGMVATLKTYGLNNKAEELQYGEGTNKLSRVADKWTPAEWALHVDPLAAKVAQGKGSEDEQRTLKILQQLRTAKEARFRDNPEQAASASGIRVPQFDPDNPTPQSIAARATWAESWAHIAHLPEAPYLSKDQLGSYRQRANQGPVAQLEIANELAQTWGAARATSIVRQIGGEPKADMLVMLGLEPRMADLYRKGLEQLKSPGFKFDDAKAEELFQPFKRGLPVELQNSVFNAAKSIVAGYAAEQGKAQAGGGNFDHVFGVAVHRAVGMLGDPTGRGATGGFIQWNGRYAVLPPTMSRQDFQAHLSRAAPQDWVNAAVDPRGNPVQAVPHHMGPDGRLRPYTKPEAARLFGHTQLETVSPGIYRLIGADGNPVVDQHSQPWQFDIGRLP